jgi:hypothetical protein
MVTVSLLFFGLYIVGVTVLHGGLDPLNETATLLYDMLPSRAVRVAPAKATDAHNTNASVARTREADSEAEFVAASGYMSTGGTVLKERS